MSKILPCYHLNETSFELIIKHEKRVVITTRSGVFLTNFEVFHLVMKRCVECSILLLKQNDFTRRNQGYKNEQFFHLLSKHLLNINFLYIFFMNYHEFEKNFYIVYIVLFKP